VPPHCWWPLFGLIAHCRDTYCWRVPQELVDGIEAAMLQRLRDKAPAVRAEAAAVLARLAQPDEVQTASSRSPKKP
jgi:hypothetical protein